MNEYTLLRNQMRRSIEDTGRVTPDHMMRAVSAGFDADKMEREARNEIHFGFAVAVRSVAVVSSFA